MFTLSSNQGNSKAQFVLGKMHENGIGVEKNMEEAVRFFKLSADKDFHEAQYKLASMYSECSYGVEKNIDEAIRLFTLASASGHKEAAYKL